MLRIRYANWHKFWKIDSLLDISAGIAAIPWVFTLNLPFNPWRGRNASNKPPLCVNLSRASALKLSRNPGAANRWFRCLSKISHSQVEKRWPIEVKKAKLFTLLHCPVQPVLPSPSTFMPKQNQFHWLKTAVFLGSKRRPSSAWQMEQLSASSSHPRWKSCCPKGVQGS